jgi:hypothetical protein
MTRRKQRSSRERAFNLAAEVAGLDAPLDVLLRMMRDPAISNRDRIDIAKICLPFVHPRIAQLRPSESEPERESVDVCDPGYMQDLVRALAFSLTASAQQGREVPAHVFELMKSIPRALNDLHARASGNVLGATKR